jgi:dual-specificity kinase
MSLITRKRPRGFSDTIEKQKSTNHNKSLHLDVSDNASISSGSTIGNDTASSPSQMNFSTSTSTNSLFEREKKSVRYRTTSMSNNFQLKPRLKIPTYGEVSAIDEHEEGLTDNDVDDVLLDDNDDHEQDDDLVILEEREIIPKSRRNNSDSLLFLDYDSFAAYNMFNVNNDENIEDDLFQHFDMNSSIFKKKQRTNSLPQLPQVKCFYHKLPNNYILQTPKISNIKANVIPHQLNLPPCDDEHGHYIIKVNEIFANRFIIIKLLGQGTFGKVVQCFDKVNREHVAIKIIRNIQKYRDAAKIELRVLSTLKKFDNENLNHCIHLRECFDFRGHICIVTDLLKISLYDFLENNKFIPFPGSHIQAISKQLIRSVTFLHDLNLIHTDLKPENILLHEDSFVKKSLTSSTLISAFVHLSSSSTSTNSSSSSSCTINNTTVKTSSIPPTPQVKIPRYSKVLHEPLIHIIDFGSAIFNDEYHSSIVSTRHYRAPEIVLGIGWSFPCDCWSIGCILVELVIGEPLFKTHDNLEHLAMIEKVCGYPIDKELVKLSKQKENECGLEYFTNDAKPHKHYYDNSADDSEDDLEEENSDNDEFDDDDVIIDDETTQKNSLRLKFPTISTPEKYIKSVRDLERIDTFVSNRIGLDINLEYSLSMNYQKNKHIINFGNFTFWWFFIDLLKKLFVINPRYRMTAEEALNHPWFNLGIEDEGTT